MANEKRLIDANAENADSCETTKIKTHFAKIVVCKVEGKPHYDILWIDPTDRSYHIGYGSYNLDFVYQWLYEYFEMVDAPTADAVKVAHGYWIDGYNVDHIGRITEHTIDCSVCDSVFKDDSRAVVKHWKEQFKVCPFCGAKMDGDGNG